MEKLIDQLKEMSDESKHHEFLRGNIWYDIWFVFDRIGAYEIGGEPDEILSCRTTDRIEIHKIVCFKDNGEELRPDWAFAEQIERKYNQN